MFEGIRQTVSKSKILKVLLPVLLILILFFYFKVFFTTGILFNNTFLKKEVVAADNRYIGSNIYGNIHITVKGLKNKDQDVEVVYKLPNNINRQYTVTFKDAHHWDAGIENIKDESGKIVFEGLYRKDNMFLYDKNGEPVLEDMVRVSVNGESPYNEDYKISLKWVADLANFADDTIRGRVDILVIAIIIFILTAIDRIFPRFFFTIKYIFSVKDPEPSDLYIAVQKISWIVFPAIGIILMAAAVINI